MATRPVIPAVPKTQALSSSTFKLPPLDGSLTLPELFEWHGVHTPHHRLCTFAREDGSIRDVYYPEAARAIRVGANLITNLMRSNEGVQEGDVIGIVATSDMVPYLTTKVGIMRANYVVFPISARNSASAVAHLINKANIKHVLVGRDHAMQMLVHDALEILKQQYPDACQPGTSSMFTFEDLFLGDNADPALSAELPSNYRGPNAAGLIMHSSGSTAYPKPITYTIHSLVQYSLIPFFGERDLTGVVFSMHMMPMFHGMGMGMMLWTVACGLVLSAFEPRIQPHPFTPQSILGAARATNSDFLFAVPAIIEAWSANPETVTWLASRGGVMFGGGPLNKAVGDSLVSRGVKLFVQYGCTEGAIMSRTLPLDPGTDWEYFSIASFQKHKMIPYGDNMFELVLLANERSRPCVINTQVEGVDAYATSDLLIPHPTKLGFWRVFGRADDQIMHSTGEKTNPVPLESMLNQDPHVLSSVVFGRARFQAGVLIDPKPQFKFDPSDEGKLAEFRNQIWPTIEKMNAFAPQHSRLFKEMILVAMPSKPFTYTAKNTARRQAVINDYEDEIDTLYATVAETAQAYTSAPAEWDRIATTGFVREVVGRVLRQPITDDDDLFNSGCDSLQATWIRNSILHALRESAQLNTRNVSINFVYEYPTISSLADFVYSQVSGTYGEVDKSPAARAQVLRALADKYSANLKVERADNGVSHQEPDVDSVLVTGTTGSLGCFILAALISDPKVSRVYALNRASGNGVALLERQRSLFSSRGLDPALLASEKVVLLEGNLTAPQLGLMDSAFADLRKSVTHIIHNAWRVDFNLALASFESNLQGLRGLVDLALTASHLPKLVFTSTIGILQQYQGEQPIKETPIAAEVATSNGYAESKWIAEEVLLRAAASTPLKPVIARVGQICGGPSGAWNANEWFPLMVRSSRALGCFPNDERDVDWIPIELAAQALCDFRHYPSGEARITHLVHPHPVSWTSIATVISEELSVPLVPYGNWLAKLEGQAPGGSHVDAKALQHVPALRLLPFYRDLLRASAPGSGAVGFPSLDTSQAVAASATLGDAKLKKITARNVQQWLSYWRQNGALSS